MIETKYNLFNFLSLFILCVTCEDECTENILINKKVVLVTNVDFKLNDTVIAINRTEVTILDANTDLESARKIFIDDVNIPILCPETFKDLWLLNALSIIRSNLRSIKPWAFVNLTGLKEIIITENRIEKIPAKIFDGLLVRKLNLSRNGITTIDQNAFTNMLKLQVLDLSSNSISIFNKDWFHYLPELYRLDFGYNSINEIQSKSFINIIKDKFKKHNLELWFMDNSISRIDDEAFFGVEKIEHLWLSNNQIIDIKPEILAKVEIGVLLLDNNRFTCFHEQFLKTLRVKEINVDGNESFDCECLKNFQHWGIQSKVVTQTSRNSVTCTKNAIEKLRDMD